MLDKDGLLSDHTGQSYPVVVIPNDMLLRTSDEDDEKKDKNRRGDGEN